MIVLGCESPADVPSGHKSNTEPWIVGHNLLIAHANAVQAFRTEFKPKFGGEIGITLNGDWTEPWDQSPESEYERRRPDSVSN